MVLQPAPWSTLVLAGSASPAAWPALPTGQNSFSSHILAYKVPTAVTMCTFSFWYQISIKILYPWLFRWPGGFQLAEPSFPKWESEGQIGAPEVTLFAIQYHQIYCAASGKNIRDFADVNLLASHNNAMEWQWDFPCYPLVLGNKVRYPAWVTVGEGERTRKMTRKENEMLLLPTHSTLRSLFSKLLQVHHELLSHHVQQDTHLHALGKGTSEISPPQTDLYFNSCEQLESQHLCELPCKNLIPQLEGKKILSFSTAWIIHGKRIQ